MTKDLRMCVACQFYSPRKEATGECRRNPPHTHTFTWFDDICHQGVWPTVDAVDWCGEFRRRDDLRPVSDPKPIFG